MALTVLYVVGSSRSGSTLLGHLLSNSPAVQDLGDFAFMNEPTSPREKVCTCGLSLDECPFWTRVDELLQKDGLSLFETHTSVRLRPAFGRFALPALPEALLGAGNRALLAFGEERSPRVHAVLQTARNVWKIFEAAAQGSGATVVIDDSKRPDSALALYRTTPPGARFRLMHLLRDGRGSTFSIMKYRDLSMAQAARNWRRRTLGALMAYGRVQKADRLRVRYEDVCTDTLGQLRTICDFAGVAWQDGMDNLEPAGKHRFGGSRSPRLHGGGGIALDERWRTEMAPEDLRTFQRSAGPVNRLLGYR